MKRLKTLLPKKSGRGYRGRITTRHQGGRQKRMLRKIDFKRELKDAWGRVEGIEYSPNRGADLALVKYPNGDTSYIIAPLGLKEGGKVIASESAPIEAGNALPLSAIPVGTSVHNIEIQEGKGGQLVRGAGSVATVQGKEEDFVLVKMPSGEIRRFTPGSWATVGQVGRPEVKARVLRKAGRKRKMGIRPTVRGTAQHPGSHPHGGGEGRSGVGLKYPKTPYGRPAVGKTRRKRKYSDNLIVKPRKKGKHS